MEFKSETAHKLNFLSSTLTISYLNEMIIINSKTDKLSRRKTTDESKPHILSLILTSDVVSIG